MTDDYSYFSVSYDLSDVASSGARANKQTNLYDLSESSEKTNVGSTKILLASETAAKSSPLKPFYSHDNILSAKLNSSTSAVSSFSFAEVSKPLYDVSENNGTAAAPFGTVAPSFGISGELSAIIPVASSSRLDPGGSSMHIPATGLPIKKIGDLSFGGGAKSEVSSIVQGFMDGHFVSTKKDSDGRGIELVSTPKRNDRQRILRFDNRVEYENNEPLRTNNNDTNHNNQRDQDWSVSDEMAAMRKRQTNALFSDSNNFNETNINETLVPVSNNQYDSLVRKYQNSNDTANTSYSVYGSTKYPASNEFQNSAQNNNKYSGFLTKLDHEVDESASSVLTSQWLPTENYNNKYISSPTLVGYDCSNLNSTYGNTQRAANTDYWSNYNQPTQFDLTNHYGQKWSIELAGNTEFSKFIIHFIIHFILSILVSSLIFFY